MNIIFLISELDRHSTIHTSNRPYGCSHCPKKFGRKDKLVRHERTHLDVKIFYCPKCHLAFNRNDAMLLHMKVHAGNDTEVQNEMFSSTMMPSNEYDAPMNLVVTEQTAIEQQLLSSWPNLNAPFQ